MATKEASIFVELPSEDTPMRLKPEYQQALLNLPRFKNVDIVDLFQMAQEKLTYTRRQGWLAGKKIEGVEITDRAFAIAVLVGLRSLTDPYFQVSL